MLLFLSHFKCVCFFLFVYCFCLPFMTHTLVGFSWCFLVLKREKTFLYHAIEELQWAIFLVRFRGRKSWSLVKIKVKKFFFVTSCQIWWLADLILLLGLVTGCLRDVHWPDFGLNLGTFIVCFGGITAPSNSTFARSGHAKLHTKLRPEALDTLLELTSSAWYLESCFKHDFFPSQLKCRKLQLRQTLLLMYERLPTDSAVITKTTDSLQQTRS